MGCMKSISIVLLSYAIFNDIVQLNPNGDLSENCALVKIFYLNLLAFANLVFNLF